MYHQTALAFLKKGYQVIPLSRKTGTPIISFKNREITEELITSINWLNCDYALLMRGVWGIDIDTHKMPEDIAEQLKYFIGVFGINLLAVLEGNGLDGYSSLISHDYKQELLSNFKKTFIEITDSGGLHILFRKQDGVDYSQKINIAPGIDIKANDNNYIKIYPSRGRSVLQSVTELPVYDGDFERYIFEPRQKIVTHYFSDMIMQSSYGNHEGKEAFDRIVNGTSRSRNDDLFKATCWAVENGKDISELERVIGSVKNKDIFTREEFELTVESARKKVSFVTIGA